MSLEALAAEIAGTDGDTPKKFIFSETPELLPAQDFHDGVLYITVPITYETTEMVGRGKNKKPQKKVVNTALCVTSERDEFEYSADEITSRGFRIPTTYTRSSENRWPLADVRAYLDGKAPIVNGLELFNELKEVYRKYLEFADETYYDVLPLFIMQSYLFRLFKATGYLHFHGTAASGKSQNLRILRALGFNTVWASSMSESSIFRRTAGWPGILAVDEAESFEGERGQQLRQILLAGYLASTTAIRAEKVNERFESVEYLIYSPKVLASINALEPVIQSRCLVVQMMPAIRPIPEFDPDSPTWADVRSRLYLWAMQQARKISDFAADWNERKRYVDAAQLVNRPWQIVQAYVILADYLGGRDLCAPLVEHFNKYFEQVNRSQEETDRQRLLLKCLPRVLHGKTAYTLEGETAWYKLKDVHDVFVDHIDEDVREYYKTRQTSRHLSSLGWKRRKQAHGGTMVYLAENDVRAQFKRRRVAPFDEDTAWLEGERTYVHAAAPAPTLFSEPTTPEPTAPDDYSWVDQLNDDASPDST